MLPKNKIKQREASMEDAVLLWQWRNEESVREMSFDSAIIPLDNHLSWLQKKMTDQQSKIYIFEYQDKAIAQVRIDGKAENNTGIVSIVLDASVRGMGLASQIISQAVQSYQSLFPQRPLWAYIKPENIASIRAFQTAGFVAEQEQPTLAFLYHPQ